MNDRLKKAHAFAKERHKGQKRKFNGKDYLTHLENTANLLWSADEDTENDVLVAALLHDVVEDTQTSFSEVDQNFGRDIMKLVKELTIDEDEMKIEGKAKYLVAKINKMSEKAFTIKLCDRLDNIMGLNDKGVPSEFRTRYMEETKYIVANINRSSNSVQKYLLGRLRSMLLYLELNK